MRININLFLKTEELILFFIDLWSIFIKFWRCCDVYLQEFNSDTAGSND